MTAITRIGGEDRTVRRGWSGWASRIGFGNATLRAFVGAVALAAIYGRVAVTHLTYGGVVGNSNGYEDVWNNYWLRTALRLHRNPFYTDYLFAPNSVSLRFHLRRSSASSGR